jgi:hypothetical protein
MPGTKSKTKKYTVYARCIIYYHIEVEAENEEAAIEAAWDVDNTDWVEDDQLGEEWEVAPDGEEEDVQEGWESDAS